MRYFTIKWRPGHWSLHRHRKGEQRVRLVCQFGSMWRKESLWVGVHYSPHNKRWCINLIPCFTFWITKPGGNTP